MQTTTILIAEDTAHVRELLVKMLEMDGFEVVATASSGAEAVEMTPKADPEVVILDYAMPGMTGLDAAREILASRPRQKIVMYTAYLTPELEQEASEAGIALCLGKVEGLETLEIKIAQLVRHSTRSR